MTTLGCFRDDFYNISSTLPEIQFTTTSQASGTLAASALVGASEVYVSQSGATALTTDTAANIISQLISAVQKSAAGAVLGFPSVQGMIYTIYIRNTNGGTLTLTAGTGVTITGTATLATTVERQYMVTVTSPTTVTFQDLGGSTLQ
jgi:ABC-type branched-subunit amino acid transport system substrate-binding protein